MGQLLGFYRETLANISDRDEQITELCRHLDLDARVSNIRLLCGYAIAADEAGARRYEKRTLTHPPGYFSQKQVAQRRESRAQHAEAGRRALAYVSQTIEFYEQWRLSDGTHLGDATKTKLLQEADVMAARGDGMHKKAEFYRVLAKRMTGIGKLSRFVSEDQAMLLRDQIFQSEVGQAAE